MKTISSRFLKGALAILLVVVMLFGSTITGFAAVVDNADTSANVDVAETEATVTFTSDDVLFFNMKAVSWWTAGTNGNGNFAYFFNNSTNKNAWSAHAVNYSGDIYYVKIPAGTWEGVILTRNNTSTAPSWDNKWNQTGNISLSSTSNYISKFSENSTSATWSTQKPASAGSLTASSTSVDVGDPVTLTPNLTSNTTYNEIKSTSYSISPSTGASISGNTFTATAAGTYTVTATITYNPRGYSNLTSTVTATKTITVTQAGYSYTATAGEGGTVSPTSGTASSVEITATPNAGYKFKAWEYDTSKATISNDEVDGTYGRKATFTLKADADIKATFEKLTYTVKYDVGDGIGTFAEQTKTHGVSITLHSATPTPPAKYIFSGWSDGSGKVYQPGDTYSADANVTLTAQYEKNEFTATFKDYDGTVLATQEVTKNDTPDAPDVPDRTGYIFAGWDPEVGAMTSDKTFTATYTPIEYTITFNTDGGSSIASTTYTIESADFDLPTPTKTGFDFLKWVDADGNEYSTIETGSYGNLELTAVYTQLYYAIVDGDTVTSSDYYGAGKEVTLTFDVPTGKYLKSVTAAPAMTLTDENIDKENGTVTFTMPENNVTFTPQYGDMYMVNFSADIFTSTTNKGYYYPGEEVTINVTPKGGHVITDVTSEQTEVTYANKVITFTMPAENVTLDVEYSASFKAYSKVTTVHIDPDGPNVHTGYDNRVQGGTVTMTCNGATLAEGGYVDGDVTYTASVNSGYEFVGFFGDAECNKLLSADTTYTVSPESDITVYALYARTQYIKVGNASSTNTFYQMKYDYKLKAYTMVYTNNDPVGIGTAPIGTTFNNGFDIVVSYQKSGQPYVGWGSADFSLSMNGNSYGRSMSWGQDVWHVDGKQDNTELPLTIIVKPESITKHNKIDVSARAVKNGATIYLSSGRVDVPGSYVSAVFDATTKFTDEDITNPTDIDVANEGEIRERYKKYKITEPRTVSFETTITGTAASDYYVDRFVVYHIETESYEIVTPNPMGNNKYQGSVYVESDCYIVPIYFVTEAYATENNLAQIDIYFDATAIKDQAWGPFVACYAWGSNNAEYFGGWSAQLMIPSEDGTSFYTMLTVPKATATNPSSIPNGVTFNNYTQSTVPGSNPGAFGISATQYQCYDYREPITLYEAGYEVITFVAKDSTDGYHGDRGNGVPPNTVTSSTTDIFNKYDFDYLYSRDGATPMDFNGNTIEGVTKIDGAANADYYVISKGDITYKPNGTKYVGDSQFDADWAVDWYIFDKDGKFITNILSTAMWDDIDENLDELYTYLHQALRTDKAGVAGKTVAISYEHENNADHQVSYDGQWYGNMLDHKVVADVKVGEIVGSNFNIDDDNINDTYGEGYVIDVEGDGGKYQSVEISLDLAEVSLSANTKSNDYYFVGWYTYANGKYTQIGKSLDYTTYIDNNKTYYAMFRKIGDDQVVINHMVYNNPNDPDIPSHGGKSTMWVEIYKGDTLISKSTPNTSSSTAIIDNAENGTTYTVKVYTTPLMNGEFFAWYTDSYKADGTKTYEEILTEQGHKNSTTTVEATFEYKYDLSDDSLVKNINIYSDVKRVSNEATIKFNYFNRFGIRCTYTVKNVPLTDEECEGYDGNDYQEYVPTYFYELTLKSGEKKFVKPGTEGDYDIIDSKNNLHQYIPNETVTDAFNDEIKWVLDEKSIKVEKSLIEIWADQDPPEYTVNYTMGSESDYQTGVYNDLIKIKAPATLGDKKFSYWYEPATKEILCYTTYYNYRIVENKTIEAVYGVDVTQPWTPSINSVTYTREYADDHDIVYTDYLLAYNNKDAAVLKDVQESEGIKFGLLVYRDANYYIEDSADIEYPKCNDDIKGYLKRTAKDKEKNMAFTVDGTKYNCYYYNLTDKVDNLTVFNRMDYFIGYHNKFVVNTDTTTGKDYYYHNYAFKAVSYIIVGDEVYLSKPKDVDFYDLGTELVNSNAGN